MNKKLIGTLASVVLLTGITTGTTSLAQEVEDGTNNEQNTQPVVSENKSESVEQNTQPVVTEQKSEPAVEQKIEQPVEQKVVVEQTQEVVEENTSNEVDNVESNKTNDIQSTLEVDEVDKSIDENENVNEENSDVKEEDKEEIEAPDLSQIEPEIDEEEVLEEVVENEENEVTVEVQSNENNEDETSYNSRDNQQYTSLNKPQQKKHNDKPEKLVEDEETPLDEITPDITESQPLSLHDAGSETKYIVELDKEEADEEKVSEEEVTDEEINEEAVEEEVTDEAETVDEEINEEAVEEEVTEEAETVDEEIVELNEEEVSEEEVTDEEIIEEDDEEVTDEEIVELDKEEVSEEEVTDEAETVDEEINEEADEEVSDEEADEEIIEVVDDAELSEPVLVEDLESSEVDTEQLTEHEVNALSQKFDNSSNYNNSLTFEIDNTVDNDWQTILNERGTSHITFEREGIEVSIERLENDRIEVTYAFRDALNNMSEEELESFIYGEFQKDKANINEGGQTEFLTKSITDRLNDTSSNPSVVHGASETSLSTPQELPKTGIALIGGTVGSALALLFSGAFAGLFSLRRK